MSAIANVKKSNGKFNSVSEFRLFRNYKIMKTYIRKMGKILIPCFF